MDKTWPVQDAKARFSEIMREAEKEPQMITRHGEEAAVLMSAEEYRRLRGGGKPARSLYEIWKSAPKTDLKLPPRKRERMRSVKL